MRPEIWSYGYRNVQAAAIDPVTRELWEVEHCARGADELNIVRAGKDYGGPTISYGIEYDGKLITGGITAADGMEPPRYYWIRKLRRASMIFYTADLFSVRKGGPFIGGMGSKALVRRTVDVDRVDRRRAPPLETAPAHPRRAPGTGRCAVPADR